MLILTDNFHSGWMKTVEEKVEKGRVQIDPPLFVCFVFLEEQYVSDIVNYIDHGDPQIRGATAILCGTIVCSILTKSRFDVENWLSSITTSTGNTWVHLLRLEFGAFSCALTLIFFFNC